MRVPVRYPLVAAGLPRHIVGPNSVRPGPAPLAPIEPGDFLL